MPKKIGFNVEDIDIPKIPLEKWVMAIIRDKGEKKPIGPLTLMNKMFIFAKEVLPFTIDEMEFKRTGCGPYSEKIAESVRKFCSSNILEIKEDKSPIPEGYGYSLTEKGAKKAEKSFQKLPEELREEMEFRNHIIDCMGLWGMLQYIRSIYPEFIYLHEGGDKNV